MSGENIVVVIQQNEVVAELTVQSVSVQPAIYEVTATQIVQEVTVTFPGPQGPPGPTGPADVFHYLHHQVAPSSTWTVFHNLGKYPNVGILNDDLEVIHAKVVHNSVNQLTVFRNNPDSGYVVES